MRIGEGTVAVGAAAALPKPRIVADTATYRVSPDTSLVLRATPTGFDLNVILRRRPRPGYQLRLPLTLHGVRASLARDGRLRFSSTSGIVATSDPIEMWGTKTNRNGDPSVTSQPRVVLRTIASTETLVVTPSAQFLASSDVVYPVTIDPTSDLSVGVDTYVDQAHPTSTFVNNAELKSGLAGTSQIQRSLLSFDTSALAGDTINSATLNLFETLSGSCTTSQVQVWSLTGTWSGSSTWNTQPTKDQEWASGNTGVGFGGACPENWVQFSTAGTGGQTLTNLVQDWASGTATNHGLEVVAGNESSGSSYKRFNSADNTSDQPYLEVNYSTSVTTPTVSGGSSAWQSVSSIGFTASGSTTTGSATITGYNYRTSTDGGTTWSSPATATSGSASVSSEGSTLIQFQGVDSTGNTSAWAPSTAGAANTAKIDRTAPSTPSVTGGSLAWQGVPSVSITGSGSTDALSGVDHYEYRESTDGGSTWSSSTTGAVDTVTRAGQTLVQFRAVDGATNSSGWTPTVAAAANTVRIDRTGPAISSTTHPDPTQGYAGSTFDASWTPPSGMTPTGYAVVLDDAASTVPTTVTQTGTAFEQTGITPGSHFLHVRAQDADGQWSTTATFPFTDFALMSPSTGLVSSSDVPLQAPAPVGAGDVTFEFRNQRSIDWSPVPETRVTDDSGDPVAFPTSRDSDTGNTAHFHWDSAATIASDPSIGPNFLNNYSGKVEVRAAMTASGGGTVYTATTVITLDQTPPQPLSLTTSPSAQTYADGTSVTVSWTPVTGDTVDGYSVLVDTDPRTSAPQAISTTDTSQDVTSDTSATEYLHIRSVDDNGNWSATQTVALTFAARLFTAPADGTVVDGTDPITFTTEGATSENLCLEYSTPGSEDWLVMPSADVTLDGSPVAAWPVAVSDGVHTWVWSSWDDAQNIDGWPGEIDTRMAAVGDGLACDDTSATTSAGPSLEYQPASGGSSMHSAAGRSRLIPLLGPPTAAGGTTLLYRGQSQDTVTLERANGDGSGAAPAADGAGTFWSAGASDDGSVTAYVTDSGIRVDSLDTGTEDHTVDGTIDGVSVSPNGNYVAFLKVVVSISPVALTDSIWVTPTNSWGPTEVTSADFYSYGLSMPTFTRNSQELIYAEGIGGTCSDWCGEVHVEPVDPANPMGLPSGMIYSGGLGPSETVVATEAPGSDSLAIETGDHEIQVFHSDDETIISDLVSAYATTSTNPTADDDLDGTTPGMGGPVEVSLGPWSPDGTTLLIGNDGHLTGVDPDSGATHFLASTADEIFTPLGWTDLPTSDHDLELMFRPDLLFSSEERFRPLNADQFLAEENGGDLSNKVVQWYETLRSDPTVDGFDTIQFYPKLDSVVASSNTPGTPAWYRDQLDGGTSSPTDPSDVQVSGNQLDVGAAGTGDTLTDFWEMTDPTMYHGLGESCDPLCDPENGPIYAHVVRAGTTIYIQYWFFYRFNDTHQVDDYAVSCDAFESSCDQHQGDWEGAEVAIDGFGKIEWVAMSQHTSWRVYRNDASGLQNEDFESAGAGFGSYDHVNVYVAAGTHADYPMTCTEAGTCYNPEIAGNSANQYGLLDGYGDANHDGGSPWVNNADSSCGSECVIDLESDGDFLSSTMGSSFLWGVALDTADADSVLERNFAIRKAPAGPDGSDGNHSALYADPTSSALLLPGAAQTEFDADGH
jgi:hypothetical protein